MLSVLKGDYMKKFYPALFHEEDGRYWVTFPDIPECITEGDTLDEAYEMAKDAMGICFMDDEDNFSYPTPSSPKNIIVDDNSFCVMVEFDELEYLRNTSSRSVKKTLTIPEWMNRKALKMNLNFSKILQDGLQEIFDRS